MSYNITLIPGDGIGPEVVDAARRCVEATGCLVEWDVVDVDGRRKETIDEVLRSIRKNKVALKGPVTTPIGKGFRSVNVLFRQQLDLFAGVRPCKIYPGVKTRFEGVDIVVVRENTEDLYAGIEFRKGDPKIRNISSFIRKDAGVSVKPISVFGSRRIVEFAFEYAKVHGRRKVTAGHKANIMKYTDGLFLDVARRVAR